MEYRTRARSQPARDSVSFQSEIRPVRWQDDAGAFNNTRVTFRFSPVSSSPRLSFFVSLRTVGGRWLVLLFGGGNGMFAARRVASVNEEKCLKEAEVGGS